MTGDEARRRAGYLTAAELVEALPEVLVLDPAGTMVSPDVSVAAGAVLYPGVVLHAAAGGRIELGASRLWPGTRLLAEAGGSITVGDGCVFEGGVTLRAAGPAAAVRVGARCRLSHGAELLADADLGDGAQMLGRITARDVVLAGGGSHADPDPDTRGAVLKGFGTARGLRLAVGEVVNGAGDFARAPVERQSAYHPKRDSATRRG